MENTKDGVIICDSYSFFGRKGDMLTMTSIVKEADGRSWVSGEALLGYGSWRKANDIEAAAYREGGHTSMISAFEWMGPQPIKLRK